MTGERRHRSPRPEPSRGSNPHDPGGAFADGLYVDSQPPAQRPPKGLGPAGRDLWRKVQASFELDGHEVPGLLLACRQLADVARLEELLERDGLVSTGSSGQPRLSQVVAELRQSRLAASKLLDALGLPLDDTGATASPAAKRARRAAESRWAGHVPVRERLRNAT